MFTDALPVQEPWKLSVAEVTITPLPLDWTRRFCDVMPLMPPVPSELIVELVVVKFPSMTCPEPVMLTSTDCVASPESTSTCPLPEESITAVGVVTLPRITCPEPLLVTFKFRVA
jgi:hypothetical protein